MNLKEIVVRVTTKEAAKVAVNAGSNLVLLHCQKPGEECCNFVYYLFVNKKFNKDNKDKMREFNQEIHLKRLTDADKKNLLGKGTCAKVHCYEVDQVIEERLEPDSFKQYVKENTLHRCAPGIPVAPV